LSGNQLLALLLEGLQTRVGPFLSLARSSNRDRLLEHHLQIADAVLGGDGRAAARAMRRHVTATLRAIMALLPDAWLG
jgi:DNA-binding GntR family transcriptional regulator